MLYILFEKPLFCMYGPTKYNLLLLSNISYYEIQAPPTKVIFPHHKEMKICKSHCFFNAEVTNTAITNTVYSDGKIFWNTRQTLRQFLVIP